MKNKHWTWGLFLLTFTSFGMNESVFAQTQTDFVAEPHYVFDSDLIVRAEWTEDKGKYRVFRIEKVIWGTKYGLKEGDHIRVAPATERECEQLRKPGEYRLYLQHFQQSWQLIRQCHRSAVKYESAITDFHLWDHNVKDSVDQIENWIADLRKYCFRNSDYEIRLDPKYVHSSMNPIIRASASFTINGIRRDTAVTLSMEVSIPPPAPASYSDCAFSGNPVEPELDSGDLNQFFQKNVNYPAMARDYGLEGMVVCQLTINNKGEQVAIKVLKSVHPTLDAEAMRVISKIPHWTARPGAQTCTTNLPVRFVLNP